MLTARDEVGDKVLGLELGADDYVTKPFVLRELLARVRAVLRRTTASPAAAARSPLLPAEAAWTVGELEFDPAQHMVRRGGTPVELSPKEFRLFCALARQPGTPQSRSALIEQVWGDEFMGDEKTLDVHIRWLREKIEQDPSHPSLILTVRGTGYMLAGEHEDGEGDRA
jgi:DNA-binding response OmpR family regulator